MNLREGDLASLIQTHASPDRLMVEHAIAEYSDAVESSGDLRSARSQRWWEVGQ